MAPTRTAAGHGWSSSDRRQRLPSNWNSLRAEVSRRAGGRCQHRHGDGSRCTAAGTDCDHIVPGDDHRLENLQWLCSWHHGRKTEREAQVARARRSRLRPVERHPGLIGEA